MPYRDDRDALRARVQDLETELAASRETIARLQGERASEEVREQPASWFTGAPGRLDLERELPFELTDAGYEAVAEVMRARLAPQGQISQVGRTLTYRLLGQELRVTRTDKGSTQVRLTLDQRGTSTAFALGLPGAIILALAPVAAILQAKGFTPLSLVVALPLVVGVVYALLRPLVARAVHTQRDKLRGVFESVLQVAAQHAKPARVRVEPAVEAAAEPRSDENVADPVEAPGEAEQRAARVPE